MIVSFKFYMMNFVDFMLNCYSHITSHVSQAFISFTHYTSYSLLNIVHINVCVFGLNNQVCKYFEFLCKTNLMLENLWRMFENLKFGITGLKLVFLKIFASHTHAFCSYFSMLGGIYAKTGLFFSKLCFFWNFNWLRLFFNQSKLTHNFWVSLCLFWSIEPKVSINRKSCGMFFYKQFFRWVKHFFKKFSPFSLSIRLGQGKSSFFLLFSICLSARFSSLQAGKSILPFLLHFISCFHA